MRLIDVDKAIELLYVATFDERLKPEIAKKCDTVKKMVEFDQFRR